MKLKHIFLFFFTFATISSLMAQSLPRSCEAYIPRILNKATITRNDVAKLCASGNYGQDWSTSKYWDAYSDRCDNVLYATPGGAKNGNSLKFNQKVRIAKIQSDYALVYTENKPGAVKYPQISSDAQCLGWVPMDNLLLWTICPTNEYGIYHKALFVHDLNKARDKSFGKISQHPDPANTSHVAYVKSSVDFHYIMKIVKSGRRTRYLIAKYNKLDGTTDQVIEGWVTESSFVPWNQRLCLEPNWEDDAVDYFVSKGEQAWLYGDAQMSVKTQSWTFGSKNNEGQVSTQYRMAPRSMRLPILDFDKKSNMFHVVVFASAGGDLGQESVETDDRSSEESKDRQDSPNTVTSNFLQEKLGKDYDVIKRANALLAYSGYTNLSDATGRNYWQPVLYLSSEELLELIKRLEPLKFACGGDYKSINTRDKYVKAIAGIIQSMTEISAAELDNLSTDDLTRIIAGGLNVTTDILNGTQTEKTYKLSEIKNPQACSDEEFKIILKKMSIKIDNLSELPKGSAFKYSFVQNGVRSYWVPLSMIP